MSKVAMFFECKAKIGQLVVPDGFLAVLVETDEGDVRATNAARDKRIPKNAKVFSSENAAVQFMQTWVFRPFFFEPNGVYHVTPV